MNLEHTRICTTLGTIRVKTSHLEETKLIYWITVTSLKQALQIALTENATYSKKNILV